MSSLSSGSQIYSENKTKTKKLIRKLSKRKGERGGRSTKRAIEIGTAGWWGCGVAYSFFIFLPCFFFCHQQLTSFQDNINAHFVVIKAIETRLQTAPSNELLPVVYLIDSICKNVRGVYVDAFSLVQRRSIEASFFNSGSQVIRRLFQSVYEKAPVIRDSLKRLAGTW